MNKPTRTYHPGEPGEALPQGNGQWLIQSHRTEDSYYLVDLNDATCTCPDSIYRDRPEGCKHYKQAKAEAVRYTQAKARTMKAGDLRAWLNRRQYRPEIEDAIKGVLFEKLYELVSEVQEQVRSRTYLRV